MEGYVNFCVRRTSSEENIFECRILEIYEIRFLKTTRARFLYKSKTSTDYRYFN